MAVRPFHRISVYLIVLVALIIGPLAVLCLDSAENLRRGTVAVAHERLRAAVHVAVVKMLDDVVFSRQIIAALALAADDIEDDASRCGDRLRAVMELNGRLHEVGLFDPQGRQQCNAAVTAQQLPLQLPPALLETVLGSPAPVVTTVDHAGGELLSIHLTVRVLDDDGAVRAVIGAVLDAQLFLARGFEELPAASEGAAGSAFSLWTTDGRVLARLPRQPGKPADSQADSVLFRALMASPANQLVEAVGLDGVRRAFAIERFAVGDTHYWLAGGQAAALISAQADALFRHNLMVILGVTGLAALLAWFAGRRLIQKPVARLKLVARAIRSGDLEARVGAIGGTAELRELGAGIDEMAGSLAEREAARQAAEAALADAAAALESKVAERTEKLEKATRDAQWQAVELHAGQVFGKALNEFLEMIQASASTGEAMHLTVELMPSLLPGMPGAIYLYRASRNLLERAAQWGPATGGRELTTEDCWGLRLGHTHILGDSAAAPRCRHVAPEVRLSICAPLLAKGEVIGLLHLLPDRDRQQDVLPRHMIEQVARSFALAFSNVRLREALREQSVRDPLTGLYNRRFADEMLDRELARADRSGVPLSVLMVDIDHFKRFNDSFGHEGGDIALRQVGAFLRQSCRASDVAARFGGEEFLVLLPGTDPEAAFRRAEDIRQGIAALPLHETRGDLPAITASLGVATYPAPIADPSQLVTAADRALYAAKAAGRNQVLGAE